MIYLSDVEWGPIDADRRDPRFVDKWIEPANIKNLLDEAIWLITGEKGSGKTAICRAIKEKHAADLFSISEVNFDKVGFSAIYSNLVELVRTTNVSKLATLSNFWQFAIVSQLIIDCAKKDYVLFGDLAGQAKEKTAAAAMPERILALLENCWNYIDRITGKTTRKKVSKSQANLVASKGLSAQALTALMAYPLDGDYIKTKREFFRRISSRNLRVVLLLDGFDLLRNDDIPRDGVRLIFESLIEAVREINTDAELPEQLGIKALVPHDRYLSLTLGDSDKVSAFHLPIRWGHQPLKLFLEKRMALCPSLHSSKFNVLWREVIPERVVDPSTRIEEDTLGHLLRHSMYRPRHLQLHLQKLAKSYPQQIIQPSMICPSIVDSSKDIAKFFIDEYKADHPNLGRFIANLSRTDAVLDFSRFRSIIADAIKRFGGVVDPQSGDNAIEEKIDTLYAMGFFGIVKTINGRPLDGDRYWPASKGDDRRYVDFYYLNPQNHVGESLDDGDLVAFHPIIACYAEMRPSADFLVG